MAKITRLLAGIATVLFVALVLFRNSSSPSRGSWDDLAVMRAAAWLTPCGPEAPLARRLREHFEKYGALLPKVDQMRYQKRAELRDTYPLSAAIIRTLERSGYVPVLRNVVTACWLQHVLVVFVVVLLLGRRHSWLVLALLVAALTIADTRSFDLAEWVPFQRHSLTWAASAPRGASTVAWFGAIVAWLTLVGPRRIATVLAFVLLSWFCHRAMALLCLAASAPTLLLLAVARRRVGWPPTRGMALAGFGGLALLAAGAKLALLWTAEKHFPLLFTASGTGSDSEVRHARWLLFAWALLSLALLEVWRRSRDRLPSKPASAALRETGDTIASLFAVAAAVALGLNVAHPPIEVWYGPLFFVWEVAMRVGAIPHLLFFALLALVVRAHAPRVVVPLTLSTAALGALLVGLELRHLELRTLPEQKRSLPKLLAKGRSAYSDEVQYYLSVGTEVVARGCGETLR